VLYRFGPFTLDAGSFAVLRGDTPVPLPPKLVDLLRYLVVRPSTLVSKEELFQSLWPDVVVTDNALTQAVSDLRQALGDDRSNPTYIQTVAKRGYRFVAPVEVVDAEPAPGRARRRRESSSLDAHRALTEGRLQLESLDASEVAVAIDNFKRAIDLDPSLPGAYVGLANAHFWMYEMSRHRDHPDASLLSLAIEQAECAVALDAELGEAHATLSYLLVGANRCEEARAAALRAIALEPGYWAHYFRLGNATWGGERLAALRQCLDLYPEFPFAHFQMAMVYVARNALELATQALRQGTAVQEGRPDLRKRFPANGLHWMRGVICLRRGDAPGAVTEFGLEIDSGRHQLYGTEYAIAAINAHGFALLHEGEPALAREMFQRALELSDDQTRARLGLAQALLGLKAAAEANHELARVRDQVADLQRVHRTVDAAIMSAGELVVRGEADQAIQTLSSLVADAPPGSAGWSIPIEPLFVPLRQLPAFETLLATLSARAR
jgi:DNA-binding winged helix-turn-helix (wHTH) protein